MKTSKIYEVSFEDKELIEALVHWISNVRSRNDMIAIGNLIHASTPKVIRRNKKTFLRFTFLDDEQEF